MFSQTIFIYSFFCNLSLCPNCFIPNIQHTHNLLTTNQHTQHTTQPKVVSVPAHKTRSRRGRVANSINRRREATTECQLLVVVEPTNHPKPLVYMFFFLFSLYDIYKPVKTKQNNLNSATIVVIQE
uniref:(northern house mosquito) hypothetical protein n=1 Tax=Culex pipiens TaxID=7175 RepID=A0A8D8D8M3_CULPI